MSLRSKRRLSSYSRRNVTCFWLLGILDIAIWVLDDLIEAVGPVDRSTSLKALSTRVNHGILIEDAEFTVCSTCWREQIWEVLVHESETHQDWVCSFLTGCVGPCAHGITSNFDG